MAVARQRIRLPEGAWRRAASSLAKGTLWEGTEVGKFEQAFAAYIGTPDAVTVPSGRAGLKFLFDGLGLSKGSEIICSAFGYPIDPFIVKSLGYELKFVDCELHTLGMDPELLAETISDNTAAVIGTHLYGVPFQVEKILGLTQARDAYLIEDCAHCYGAAIGDRKVGSYGVAGFFSFETSKVINTMGGGMVTVQTGELGNRIRDATGHESHNGIKWLGKRLSKTTFESLVTNPLVFNLGVYQALRFMPKGEREDRFASGYHGDEVSMAGKMGRYTNYQAALGLASMQTVDEVVAARRRNAERLIGNLDDILQFQKPMGTDVQANYMLVSALVSDLDVVSECLLRAGIDTKHLYMRDCSKMFDDQANFPNAARAEKEVLHIPAHPSMSIAEIDRLSERIRVALESM